MISCDTNILFYYINSDCREHSAAAGYMEPLFASEEFAICELVLIELYVLLRSPKPLPNPLSGSEALSVVQGFRNNPHWALIDYPGTLMDAVWKHAQRPNFSRREICDARIAETMRYHGIEEFATRNVRHFESYGFKRLVNPID